MDWQEIKPKSYPTMLLNKNWKERKCYYRKNANEFINMIHDMEVKDDDVWLITLPKCGTTWMQELLWLVMHDFDFVAAKNEHLEIRTPFLEFEYILNENINTALKPVENLKSPRLIKSHLPLPLLPEQLWNKKPKVIYVYRNPKDSFISEYYFTRSMGFNMDKSLEEYINDKMESNTGCSSFDHVTEFYSLRNESWLYYTSFEYMKKNLAKVISDICKFLNIPITDIQMVELLQHLSFNMMKVNPKTNHIWEIEQIRAKVQMPYENHNFIRKGMVNGYKDDLSIELIAKMDDWINKHLTKYNISMSELLLLNE